MKTTYSNDKFTLVLFVIYTIFYESLVWGLTASSIYYLDFEWPIIIVAMIVSSAQLKYRSFYVSNGTKEKDESDELKADLNKK